MIEEEYEALIELYQSALKGESIKEKQLIQSSITFLQNLRFALQEAVITQAQAVLMAEFLYRHSANYEEFVKSRGNVTRSGENREEKKRLIKALKTEAEAFSDLIKATSPRTIKRESENAKTRKRQNRIHRQKWVRS